MRGGQKLETKVPTTIGEYFLLTRKIESLARRTRRPGDLLNFSAGPKLLEVRGVPVSLIIDKVCDDVVSAS